MIEHLRGEQQREAPAATKPRSRAVAPGKRTPAARASRRGARSARGTPGARTLTQSLAPPPARAGSGTPAPGYIASVVADEIARAGDALVTVRDVLRPAYRCAVDDLDPAAALKLADAVTDRLLVARAGLGRAAAELPCADPYLELQSRPGAAPEREGQSVPAGAVADHQRLEADLAAARAELEALEVRLTIEVGPQVFRDRDVLGARRAPAGDAIALVTAEAATVARLLSTFHHVRHILGGDASAASDGDRERAVSAIEMWRSRPVNFKFLRSVLIAEELWQPLTGVEGQSGRELEDTLGKVREQSMATGDLANVGDWDRDRVAELLSRGVTDWAITDENAEEVFRMLMSAAPDARGRIVLSLAGDGRLGALCDNLTAVRVSALYDAMTGPDARRALVPYAGRSPGRSLSARYEDRAIENLREGDYAGRLGWTILETAHDALTFGFLGVHDRAYDAREQGRISSAEYWSTATHAAARSAAIAGATFVTGGAAGAWAEGAAAGLRVTPGLTSGVGAAVGGATSGVAGQLTADVYDQAHLGKEGFSGAGTYALAGGLGAVSGAATPGLPHAHKLLPRRLRPRAKARLDASMKRTAQAYADRYPGLDNLLTRLRGAGRRSALRARVTGQELSALARAGLVDGAQLSASLARIRTVWASRRVDISRPLSKVHPRSEIEQMFGTVDEMTGEVAVRNTEPSEAGFVAAEDHFPPGARASDDGVREALGIDKPPEAYDKVYERWGSHYDKYAETDPMSPTDDPLYEVVLQTDVELDVPLPQDNTTGMNTPLGAIDPVSQHVPGAGATKGGIPEGVLPKGAPIEILEVRPVGTPRARHRTAKPAEYRPYSRLPMPVRNLESPLAGAGSGPASRGSGDAEE